MELAFLLSVRVKKEAVEIGKDFIFKSSREMKKTNLIRMHEVIFNQLRYIPFPNEVLRWLTVVFTFIAISVVNWHCHLQNILISAAIELPTRARYFATAGGF